MIPTLRWAAHTASQETDYGCENHLFLSPLDIFSEGKEEFHWEIVYADGGSQECNAPASYNPYLYNYERWTPSIHMPRWFSRVTLEVTGVRVERLQEISETDAHAEGVERVIIGDGWRRYADPETEMLGQPPCATAIESYASLWDKLNEKRASWKTNPFVWVIEFRRI